MALTKFRHQGLKAAQGLGATLAIVLKAPEIVSNLPNTPGLRC
jgi:hypothetical protein